MPPQSCTHSEKRLQNYKQPIKLSGTPIIRSGCANQQKQKFILDCVQEMLQKDTIILVRNSSVLQQTVSRSKTREKIETSNRFECLKMHLSFPTFKMETTEVIRNSICKGEWVVSFTQGQNHTNRMVSSSQDFSDDLPNLAQTNGRHVCNQNEQQTTSVSPDPNAMAVDALNISWEALDGYAYCPIALIPKMIKK